MLSCTAVNDSATILPAPETPTARPLSSRWRKDLLFFSIAAAIVCADQLTKWLVRTHLGLYEQWPDHSILGARIIHVVNSGAAFGILQGQTPFLIVTSLLGLGAILMYYLYPPMEHGLIRVALGMQLGGAIGNFIDRVRVGEVTDFIDVGRFPTFNVADSCISVSIVAVLIFFALQETEEGRKNAAPPPVDASSTPTHED
jgi:signal peptidase II